MNPLLRTRVLDAFLGAHGREPAHVVQAPGRVNLIGEHTDYNDGFALPAAIDRGTVVAIAPRKDSTARVTSANVDSGPDEFRLDAPIEPSVHAPWVNYVRGVVKHLQEHGMAFGGADIALAGNVPTGAGLSSSASLEVAIAQAFKTVHGLDDLSPTDLALIAQRAENQFVGCNCGIMDQLISARGRQGHAMLIDCRSLDAQPVRLPEGMAIVIVESRVQRGLVDSEYNVRRRQCEAVAAHFGLKALRDLDLPTLEDEQSRLDPVAFRRARHVVTENLRTLKAAAALARGDLRRMGELMAQSHESMRLDFEITVPAIDELAAILQSIAGEHGGARMTGGGFGGCVVALMPEHLVPMARASVEARYRAPSGEHGVMHVCTSADGAGELHRVASADEPVTSDTICG
jgi:galactokinase